MPPPVSEEVRDGPRGAHRQVSTCPFWIIIAYRIQPLLEWVSSPRSLRGEEALLSSLTSVSVVQHFFDPGGLIQTGHWSVSDAASDAFWNDTNGREGALEFAIREGMDVDISFKTICSA